MTKKYKKFSDKDKQAALILLERNEGNISKVARELGVPRKTLTMWRDTLTIDKMAENGEAPMKIKEVAENRHEVKKYIDVHDSKISDLYSEAINLGINKMINLLNLLEETEANARHNIHAATGAVKILTDAAVALKNQRDGGGGSNNVDGNQLFVQTLNQYYDNQ